jgi:hypothetical protein
MRFRVQRNVASMSQRGANARPMIAHLAGAEAVMATAFYFALQQKFKK